MPSDLPAPDLEAKLSGQQSPRGWGLFLIRNMVDEMRVTTVPGHNVMELILRFE
jgi:anti-sigma regulatory factor (Ser/Thr protein kinase)